MDGPKGIYPCKDIIKHYSKPAFDPVRLSDREWFQYIKEPEYKESCYISRYAFWG